MMESAEEESHYLAASTLASTTGSIFNQQKPKNGLWKNFTQQGRILLCSLGLVIAILVVFFVTYICLETNKSPKTVVKNGPEIGNYQDLNKIMDNMREDMFHLKSESSQLRKENSHIILENSKLKSEIMQIKSDFSREILDIKSDYQKLRSDFTILNFTTYHGINSKIPDFLRTTTMAPVVSTQVTISSTTTENSINFEQLDEIPLIKEDIKKLNETLMKHFQQNYSNKTLEDKISELKTTVESSNISE